jgi:uncharacterized membrane protein YfcA
MTMQRDGTNGLKPLQQHHSFSLWHGVFLLLLGCCSCGAGLGTAVFWPHEATPSLLESSGGPARRLDDRDQQQQQRGGPEGDDYFFDSLDNDDGSNDDAVSNDDDRSAFTAVDDFYAFESTNPVREVPHLLPFDSRAVVTYVISAMAMILGAGSGIGGGGVVVPTFILIYNLEPKLAIPVGSLTVLGGAVASTIINFPRRHPLADRPLIDWDLVLVMEPLTLLGALLGTLLHRLLDTKLLVVLLVLLLSATAHTTLSKATRMYEAEERYLRQLRINRKRQQEEEPPPPHVTSSPTNLDAWTAKVEAESKAAENNQNQPKDDSTPQPEEGVVKKQQRFSEPPTPAPVVAATSKMDTEEKERILILNPDFITLRSEFMEEEKFTPRFKITAIVGLFSTIIFLNVMLGGGHFKSPWGIECLSVNYWTVQIIMFAILISSAWAAQTYLVARHEIKEYVRFDYVHGDIKWDTRSAILYPAVFVVAGLFSGMFGIGSGIITVSVHTSQLTPDATGTTFSHHDGFRSQ